MRPALFIFADDDMTSCVYVHECDDDLAKTMIGRALTSPVSMPIRDFDPLEFTSVFVRENKSRPYDMVFTGEYDEDADDEDIELFYEVRQSPTQPDTLAVVPIDTTSKDGSIEAWLLKRSYLQ